MEIGIRELRAQLSTILDEVDKGTTVTITDRGKPRARITPIAKETGLERGIREGWISVGPGFYTPRTDTRPRKTFSLPPGVSVDEVIADDRSDDR